MLNLRETFDKFDDEFLKFELVEEKRSQRPDLHAFMLLDEISPSAHDMVSVAEHDEIWLDIDLETFAERATEYNIRELVRCGIRYDDDVDSLCMFV